MGYENINSINLSQTQSTAQRAHPCTGLLYFCELFICVVLFQLSPGDIALVKKMYKCDGHEEVSGKASNTKQEGLWAFQKPSVRLSSYWEWER